MNMQYSLVEYIPFGYCFSFYAWHKKTMFWEKHGFFKEKGLK
ncbi:hypothetical protein QSI_2816 [Clostridioides difficile P28]|nr:hypothetical protein QSI_2816 [Clostridioides difficile P28]